MTKWEACWACLDQSCGRLAIRPQQEECGRVLWCLYFFLLMRKKLYPSSSWDSAFSYGELDGPKILNVVVSPKSCSPAPMLGSVALKWLNSYRVFSAIFQWVSTVWLHWICRADLAGGPVAADTRSGWTALYLITVDF